MPDWLWWLVVGAGVRVSMVAPVLAWWLTFFATITALTVAMLVGVRLMVRHLRPPPQAANDNLRVMRTGAWNKWRRGWID